MICVTGSERAPEQIRDRQVRCHTADLHEIRLDLLDDPAVPLESLLAREPSRLIVTCRPERERGGFAGDERARIELLIRAVRAGIGFVDLEADVEPELADHVLHEATKGLTRVIRSSHLFEPGADPRREMDRLRSLRGSVLKLAIQVADAAELTPFTELGRQRDRPVVLVGMGPAGLLSRACSRRFGSAWTYAAAAPDLATAAGQLDWDQILRWKLDQGRDPSPVVLLGGPQIFGSPGPRVYNQLFVGLGAPLFYLPVQTERPRATVALLRQLGVHGASVTMPLKERIAPALDGVDPAARPVGAINTLWRQGCELWGTNTDGLGVVRALEGVRPLAGARVLVLGAGGVARAAVRSLVRSGARVTVYNRTASRARRLAEDLGPEIEVAARVEAVEFDALVNATSVGLGSKESPVGDHVGLEGKVVLDCVAQPPRTRLLGRAEREGGRPISGLEVWLHQGAAQASLWLDREITAAELRALL